MSGLTVCLDKEHKFVEFGAKTPLLDFEQASKEGQDSDPRCDPTTVAASSLSLQEAVFAKLMERDEWASPSEWEKATTAALAVAWPMPVPEYAATWMKRSTHLRPTTRNQYERHLRLRIIPGLGRVPLIELNRERVLTWWKSLDHSSERTCDLTYSLLRTILYGAVDDRLIASNPAQRIRGAGKPSKRHTVDPLTPAQVASVADAMPER